MRCAGSLWRKNKRESQRAALESSEAPRTIIAAGENPYDQAGNGKRGRAERQEDEVMHPMLCYLAVPERGIDHEPNGHADQPRDHGCKATREVGVGDWGGFAVHVVHPRKVALASGSTE